MDYVLIGLGVILMISGLLGCILPILPGPPLSYLGLLMLHFTERYEFSGSFLVLWGLITAFVYGLDFVIPVWGTKKFGGSKRGVWGSIIGMIVGFFFFPPIGIILGPFIGAVIGEFSVGKDSAAAFKSGFGSFIGFFAGTIFKVIASGTMTYYFGKELFFG